MSQTTPTSGSDQRPAPGGGADRYIRQKTYRNWGPEGQARLRAGRALVIGMGALGSAVAEILVRAGVGSLRMVDRDLLQTDNLHRQTLYTEIDALQRLPKVEAAAARLNAINGEVDLQPLALEATAGNIDSLLDGVDVLVDGTDNFATRFVMNAAAVRHRVPFVHGGCVGCDGQVMVILPGETPCLQCLMPGDPPEDGATCDSVGVLMPIVGIIASLQAMEALKLLSGNRTAVNRQMIVVSLWENRIRQVGLGGFRDGKGERCPVCEAAGTGGETLPAAVAIGEAGRLRVEPLCGRNAVQVSPQGGIAGGFRLEQVASRLPAGQEYRLSRFVLRFSWLGFEVAFFTDGRMVLEGSQDVALAGRVYRGLTAQPDSAGGREESASAPAPLNWDAIHP